MVSFGGATVGKNRLYDAGLHLATVETPAQELSRALEAMGAVSQSGEIFSAQLNNDFAQAFVNSGWSTEGAPQETITATLHVWIKDGVISKYEIRAEGGKQRRSQRLTRTITIRDVGTTTLTIPSEARARLDGCHRRGTEPVPDSSLERSTAPGASASETSA